MKILFVDNDIRRFEFLKKKSRDKEIIHAIDNDTAISILENDKFDMLSLDIDLGDPYSALKDVNLSTKAVLDFLCKTKIDDLIVIVHSHNEYLAPDYVEQLVKVGYAASWRPFGV